MKILTAVFATSARKGSATIVPKPRGCSDQGWCED